MEPLNLKERKKAFTNFIIFFTITAVLIVAAVLFSVEVPFKQNDQLRQQVAVSENEKDFVEKFFINMNATKGLLDSLNKPDANVVLIDGKIGEKLKEMEAMIKDSLSGKDFYHDVVLNLSELHAAKKEVREATSTDATMSDLKQQISSLKQDVATAQNNAMLYQTQLQMLQRRN